MKKLVIMLVVVVFVLVMGCNMYDGLVDKGRDLIWLYQLCEVQLYYIEADIDSLVDLGVWMRQNVSYESDGDTDIWSTPEETYKRGYGDCEDLTLLFMNMAWFHLGLKFDLVLVDSYERQVVAGGYVNHAEPYYNGESYSVWSGQSVEWIIVRFIYSFETIFGKEN